MKLINVIYVALSSICYVVGFHKRSTWHQNPLFTARSVLRMSKYDGLVTQVSRELQDHFYSIDLKTMHSMDRIQSLFRSNNLDASAFNGINGYGHGDLGREKYDSILAGLFGAEAAIARLQLFSGTHAIATALFGALRPGDDILGVSGPPYDTLEEVLGLRNNSESGKGTGSMRDWHIGYDQVELLFDEAAAKVNNGTVAFDLEAIDAKIDNNPAIKLIHIQRCVIFMFKLCVLSLLFCLGQ